MPDEWRVDLAEDSRQYLLRLDGRRRTQCFWRARSGRLRRSGDREWQNRFAEETEAAAVGEGGGEGPRDFIFDAGELLEAHAPLVDHLERACGAEWQVRIRCQSQRRRVARQAGKPVRMDFRHFTIHARIPGPRGGAVVEVGAGNVLGPDFNNDGLIRRIEDITANQRGRRRLRPEGEMPVLLAGGEGAIFFHEVLGHALEADTVLAGRSPFAAHDLGKRLLPAELEVQTLDRKDAFFAGLPADDEGERRENVTLVQGGVLRHFISDRWHAKFLKGARAGHCRLADFSCRPLPRMFGLYIMPGPHPVEEMRREIRHGVFAREFTDGWIDLHSGQFHFSALETFLIEEGAVTAPLGALSFRGEVRSALAGIAMIGDDYAVDKGASFCRKANQTLPVRVGQPTVLLAGLGVRQEADV